MKHMGSGRNKAGFTSSQKLDPRVAPKPTRDFWSTCCLVIDLDKQFHHPLNPRSLIWYRVRQIIIVATFKLHACKTPSTVFICVSVQ
jgi:hypothetical protein